MKNVFEVIPSILVDSADDFERRLRLIENDCRTVQIDVLDGSMFGATSWFDAKTVAKMKSPVKFELHLMVENPLPVVEQYALHVPNTVRAIIHAELDRPLGTLIEVIKQEHKMEAGMAINPETPIDEIHHVVSHLDEVLIMGVHPGASGQDYGDERHGISGQSIMNKIARIHDRYPNLPLGVDGGVNEERAPAMLEAGATRLCAASAIFNAPDPVDALGKMQKIAEKQA